MFFFLRGVGGRVRTHGKFHPYTLDPIFYQYRYEFRVSVWVWIFSRVSVSVSGYRWNTSFWGIMMVSTIIHEFLPMYVLYSLFGSSVTYQCSRAQCAHLWQYLMITVFSILYFFWSRWGFGFETKILVFKVPNPYIAQELFCTEMTQVSTQFCWVTP